ncbi:hypothetical protein BDA99DRAFT_516140 [Phascolomyces articulosus]|uniref:F-box domain-containing protein n=1 Tax=Phascolomyces articulosus TaxID=60185 RepID=A0AAD5K5T2_9FUNG|nr:hypothetical protein BDA99DRAFT_516140 [Phascolomyces articulosus]
MKKNRRSKRNFAHFIITPYTLLSAFFFFLFIYYYCYFYIIILLLLFTLSPSQPPSFLTFLPFTKDMIMTNPVIPQEIWHVIFSKLTFRECIRCTGVNRSWRSAVFGWPGLWYEISNEIGFDTIQQLQPYTPYFNANAVQRFGWIMHANHQQSRRDKMFQVMATINFLKDQQCNNIKEAVLMVDFWPTSLLYQLTAMCEYSLTRLNLLYIDKLTRDTYIIPSLVLRMLPNLTTFGYRTVVTQIEDSFDDDEPWILFEPVMKSNHLNLKELVIEMFGNGRPMLMHQLLKLLPKLQRISLNALDCSDAHAVLDSLLKYCHNIEIIEVHDGQDDNFRWDKIVAQQRQRQQAEDASLSPTIDSQADNQQQQHYHGLEYLVIDGDDRFTEVDTLQPVIKKYHDTLRLLRIKGYNPLNRMMLSQWTDLSFPRLHKLIIVNLDDQPLEEIPILTNDLCIFLYQLSDALEQVDICAANLMTDNVLHCLAHQTMKHLTSLRLSACTALTETGFICFLQNAYIRTRLKRLELDAMDLLTGNILAILVESLTSLEELIITGCKHVDNIDRVVPKFLDDLHVSCLKWFHLICITAQEEVYPEELLNDITSKLKDKVITWRIALKTSPNGPTYLVLS